MLVRPRKFKYLKNFRLKKHKIYKKKNLKFGNLGIRVLIKYKITSNFFSKLKILISKLFKKSNKRLKKFWLNYPINLPLTKKAKGTRMGSGKGKNYIWSFILNRGDFFIEFRNIRVGSFFNFFKILKQFFFNKIFYKINNFSNNFFFYKNILL